MITLAGYTITQEIYTDAKICIYRGYTDDTNALPVIIKTLKTDYPTPKELAQFRHEYEITNQLHLTGSVRPYKLLKHHNGLALILEDVGGDSLKNIIVNRKISVPLFLQLALQLASAIGELHQHNIIHKDIKSSNIIVNLDTNQIKITDFSISTKLTLENQAASNPEQLEGTLAYMSPEQTGRMSRPIDYRTDFYSLGITFYEMLVGWLPFQSNDPMELIHSHIAKVPAAPHSLNPDIPKPISGIIMKLLAKTPEERYQSAHGLIADLQNCLSQLNKSNQIKDFELGKQDIIDKFQLSQKLYGRQQESDTLKHAFQETRQGKTALILVSGDAGMGKSTLVYDLKKTVIANHGFFITGKFEQNQQSAPYHALIHALRELMLSLLTESSEEISIWQQKLITALGNRAQLLIEIIPEIEMIIGQQPAPEQTNDNHFNWAFQQLIRVFTQPEHPLVIFLDNLQWIDNASLHLLHQMIEDTHTHALLLICGYRQTPGQTPLHILEHNSTIHTHHLTLHPLTLDHIKHIIADSLHCSLVYIHGLAELVLKKTAGTPFFVNEFLKNIYQEGFLFFDPTEQRWQWHVKSILNMDMTDSAIELTNARMRKLPADTQHLLKYAACIGQQFDIKILSLLTQRPETDITQQLKEAVDTSLLIPQSETYQQLYGAATETVLETTFSLSEVAYSFAHERIQKATYVLLTEAEKQAIHYQLGKLIRDHTEPGHLDEVLFDIITHLNLGKALITTEAEAYELARLNLAAGKKSKTTNAHDMALYYLKTALNILPKDAWQKQYHLTLTLHVQAMEVHYATGHFTEGNTLFQHVLNNAQSILDQIRVYEQKIAFHISQNKMQDAVETGQSALSLLQVELPSSMDDLSILFAGLQISLGSKKIEQLADLPPMKDPHKLAALRILTNIFSPATLVAPQLVPVICFSQVKLCIEYGNSPMSANAYALYSSILCGVLDDIDAGYRFGQVALQMLERYDSEEHATKVLTNVGAYVRHWKEPARKSLEGLKKAIDIGLKNNDIEYACTSAMYYSVYLFLVGESLEKVDEKQFEYLELMFNSKQSYQIYYTQVWYQLVLNLQGMTDQPCILNGDGFNEDVLLPIFLEKNNMAALFSLYFAKEMLCYLFKDYSTALKNAELAEKYSKGAEALLHYPAHKFYYSLILLANYIDLSDVRQKERYLKQVDRNQSQLRYWARHAPMNYQHKYDLVYAERCRVLDKTADALRAYEKAIQGAKHHNYLQEEAIGNELMAEFYNSLGVQKAANLYLTDAHYAYLTWGANAKVKALEEKHPQLLYRSRRTVDANTTRTATCVTTTTTASLNIADSLDLSTIMKASQTISSEIVLTQLIKKLLHIVIENAGAQKGLLILDRQGQLFIEAEARANKTDKMVLQSIAIDSINNDQNTLISINVVNYVARTKSYVVLHDACHDVSNFTNDPYIKRTATKSLLCAPLLNKGQLIGMLYLENNLITNAFTSMRLNIIRLLSTQMAISIENALIYSKLEQAREAAETANRAKTSFLMNMSHELRTPLNAIIGYADIIKEDAEDMEYEDILPDLDKIQIAGKQLLEIISNVLDISKIEAEKMGLHLNIFDIKKLVDEVMTMIQPTTENNTLVVNCANDIGQMNADQVKVQQILLNLLSNAIKFTHEGKITVTIIRHMPVDKMDDSGFDWLYFEIADTGIGIPQDKIDNIFEAFNQIDNSTTRKYGGTGLGLTISDRFTRMMGGHIVVQSELNKGSVFTVQLPSQVPSAIDLNKIHVEN